MIRTMIEDKELSTFHLEFRIFGSDYIYIGPHILEYNFNQ